MMKFVLVAVFAGIVIFTAGCSTGKSANAAPVVQGIYGVVSELSGNQMPSPGGEKGAAHPVATTLYVYELTSMQQLQQDPALPFFKRPTTKLVTELTSDEEGKFHVQLPVGRYSIFVQRDGKFYANSFDQYNNVLPVSIEKNKAVAVNITVTDKAAF